MTGPALESQRDAFLVDREQFVNVDGAAYYILRGVGRRGEKLDIARRRGLRGTGSQEFILADHLPPRVRRHADRLLIPVNLVQSRQR